MLDCLIIGGGPAGLTAAVYLGRFRRKVQVIDGGQSRARLIPESHNYPGFMGVGGEELLRRLRAQAQQYGVPIENGIITSLGGNAQETFQARAGAKVLSARTVIMATGIVDNEPSLNIGDGDPRAVVRYCPICDGYEAMDRTVAVLGGADAAAKACFLRTYTKDVRWFRGPMSGSSTSDKAQQLGITCLGQAEQIATHPDGVEITTTDGAGHGADLLYPALGCEVRSELATALGARCTPAETLIVDAHQQTTVDGLYAIGDVVSDLHQLTVATGHGALAATAIHNRLPRNPR